MSQGSLVIANNPGAAVRSSLNSALDALKTLNSGATAPSSPSAYMWWFDTTTGLLKRRNAANSAWLQAGLAPGTVLTKNPVVFSSSTVQAHGLGVEPTLCVAVLECLTAELNYSIGNRLMIHPQAGTITSGGINLIVDATNVTLLIGTTITVLNKTTEAMAAITAANWKILVTPYTLN